MLKRHCWMCVTWQTPLPSSHCDSYHSCQTSLGGLFFFFFVPLSLCLLIFLCHYQKTREKNQNGCARGVKPRSFASRFTSSSWGFCLYFLQEVTQVREPKTGKELCVTAVRGTDQMNRSYLSCHRSAPDKRRKTLTSAEP